MKKNSASSKASKQAVSAPAATSAPNTVGHWLERAYACLSNDDMDGAILAYQNATRIDPNCDFWVAIGERALSEGQLERALRAYEQASILDPSNAFRATYWDWLGATREALGDLAGALEAYSNWAKAAPDSIEPIERAGTLMVQQGILTDLPMLRDQYVERSRYKSGSSEYNIDVLESMALYTYILEKELGSTEEPSALELAYATLRGKYDSMSMHYLLGSLYYELERYDSAENEIERVIKLSMKNNDWCEHRFGLDWSLRSAVFLFGCIAEKLGDHETALNTFEHCIAPSSDDNLLNIANMRPLSAQIRLLLEQGRLKEAEQKLDSMDARIHALLARVIQAQQQTSTTSSEEGTEEPILPLLNTVRLGNDSSGYQNLNLECQLRLGHLDAAQLALENILDIEGYEDEEDGDLFTYALDDESEDEYADAVLTAAARRKQRSRQTKAKKNLEKAEKFLQEAAYDKAIRELILYCTVSPDDEEQISRLLQVTREHLADLKDCATIKELVSLFPDKQPVLEMAHEYFQANNAPQMARLTQLSLAALRSQQQRPTLCEWFCPAPPANPALLLAISARLSPGKGELIMTGGNDSVAARLRLAHSLLRAETTALGLPDLEQHNIHVHIRPLGTKPVSLAEFNQLQGDAEARLERQEALSSCDNNIGLGLVLAMYGAIIDKHPSCLTLVGGTVDLYGNIGADPGLAESLAAVSDYEGKCWERLILPQLLAPQLMQNAIPVWGNADQVVFGTNVTELFTALRYHA